MERILAMSANSSVKPSFGCAIAAIVVPLVFVLCPMPAHAQVYNYDAVSGCYIEESGVVASCTGYPGSAPAPAQGPTIGYDPCYLAQNAMRPCKSDQRDIPKPVGVDANLIGTWELPSKAGPWVLTINRDGTYRFHSEAPDKVPPHSGSFSAGGGHWSMKSSTGYSDTGLYLFQAPDIWIATGKLGAAAWRRPASGQKANFSCTSNLRQSSSPTGVDANLVGTWKLPLKRGLWIWEILRDGTYKFHSEARDGAPSHTGTISAKEGRWSLNATTGYNDAGYYLFQAPDVLIATGKLGSAAWLRLVSNAAPCKAVTMTGSAR